MAYLDNDGVLYLWGKIKAKFADKGDVASKSSTTPLANGTAAVGSETAYAAGDHVHPTDTTRAAAADLTAHTGDAVAHVTAAERIAWNANTDNEGTVTQVSAGIGLDGGDITTTGTVKAKLKSETAHSASSATPSNTADRQYAVGVDADGYLSVNVPWTDDDTTDLTQMTGVLGIANGGTGASTITGIVKGNGTGAMTAATASDISTLLGSTAVDRATADANGNDISATYAKKTDIASMYEYKGSVASAAALPASGQEVGDVYNIESSSAYGAAGANVAWNGTAWDSLGEIFSITAVTNAELDAICV